MCPILLCCHLSHCSSSPFCLNKIVTATIKKRNEDFQFKNLFEMEILQARKMFLSESRQNRAIFRLGPVSLDMNKFCTTLL